MGVIVGSQPHLQLPVDEEKNIMKSFLRIVWTIIKAFLIACGLLAIFVVLLIVAAALLAPRGGHKIEDKSVLVFNLNTRIIDRPIDKNSLVFARLFDRDESALQLRAATDALRDAAADSRISGLYLHGNVRVVDYSSGYGALKELREAIQAFQKSGKPVIAYIDNADNRDYYLESAADQILLNPFGLLAFRGLATEGIFFKDAADKYGLEFTAIRHGRYKSAIEPFTRDDFSPENREQLDALLKAVWGDMLDTVASARKIPPQQLQALVDKEGLISAESARDRGLVTELAYQGQALDKLRKLTGQAVNDKSPFPQISIGDYAAQTGHNPVFVPTAKTKLPSSMRKAPSSMAQDGNPLKTRWRATGLPALSGSCASERMSKRLSCASIVPAAAPRPRRTF